MEQPKDSIWTPEMYEKLESRLSWLLEGYQLEPPCEWHFLLRKVIEMQSLKDYYYDTRRSSKKVDGGA